MSRAAPAVAYVFAAAVAAGLGGAACSGPSATVEPDAKLLANDVTTLCQLPLQLGYGGAPEQRRMQRRAGDTLLGLAGGRVILTDELPVTAASAAALASSSDFGGIVDDAKLAEQLRAMGEKPERVLTLAVVVSRSKRNVPNVSPIPGFQLGYRMVMDYIVRIEVRQAGRSDVIGTIDSVASGDINEPEMGPRGESLGAQKAVDEALAKAVHTFAPGLAAAALSGGAADLMIVEIPAASADNPMSRLAALQELYPELTIDQMQALAGSRERFLVLRPGPLAGLGLTAGDLLGAPTGKTLTSRAALARALAAGGGVKLVVERGGQRYMMASAVN